MNLADRLRRATRRFGSTAAAPVVFVHYHVYKNAGSSVDQAMRSALGKEHFVELDKDPRFRDAPAFNAGLIRQILRDTPQIRGFASHTFVSTVHRATDFTALPIVFLRHPLLRLASVHRFEATSPAHRNAPSGKLAQTTEFPEWLDVYLGMHNGKNYQTCVLSMNEDGEHSPFTNGHPGHIGDIRVAAERLDEVHEITGVGIVEQFETSAQKIEARIQTHLPGFRLAGQTLNQTRDVADWKAELASLERSLPGDLLARAIAANASDYALYDRYR